MLMLHDVKDKPEDGSRVHNLLPDVVNGIGLCVTLWQATLVQRDKEMIEARVCDTCSETFAEAVMLLTNLSHIFMGGPTTGNDVDYEIADMSYRTAKLLETSMMGAVEFARSIDAEVKNPNLTRAIEFVCLQLKTMALIAAGRFAITEVEVNIHDNAEGNSTEAEGGRRSDDPVPGNAGDLPV